MTQRLPALALTVMLTAALVPCPNCRAHENPDDAVVRAPHACCLDMHDGGAMRCTPGIRILGPTSSGPAGGGAPVACALSLFPGPAVAADANAGAESPRDLPFRRPPSYLLQVSLLA